jgi:hypothetical protein
MANKPKAGTITSTEVQELLRSAASKLSAREEKALRMRQGAPIGLHDPLPRRGQAHPEARAELLALEIELREKLRARAAPTPKAEAQPRPSREKDKIVRALRRLK